MLTEVGALVGVVKGLFDLTKSGMDLFGRRGEAARVPIQKLQERMSGLAEQLERSVMLSKMLPIWLKEHASVDLYEDKLSNEDVRLLDSRLRSLISDSIHDHFSGVFFRTSFAVLPGVDSAMKAFQSSLTALEQQLNGIPPGDAVSWRRAWPLIKLRMNDLRIEAVKIDNLAEHVHAQLITEIRDAASANP